MPRCKKKRCCRKIPGEILYKPVRIPMSELEIAEIELDEFEALRLCDLEGKNQIEAAEKMQISRATVQRLLTSGRKKLVESLLKSHAIRVKSKI